MTTTPISERFAAETANHEMTVLLDQGLYRHLRFKRPRSSEYWFEITTTPGTLTIDGDMGGHIFRRTRDMFEFFRSGPDINPHYWSEKVTSGRDGLMAYSEDRFVQIVKEIFVDAVQAGDAPRGLGKAVRENILDGEIWHEDGAYQALDQFEFEGFRFEDATELNFRDWHPSFLWLCHAIVHAIAAYGQTKATPTAA